jgi:hypothetical protein
LNTAYSFIKNSNIKDKNWEEKFSHVSNFCRGTAHNTLGKDRMETNPEFEFEYDVIEWLKNTKEEPLEKFKLINSHCISFQLSQKQFQTVQDTLKAYGETIVGKSKALRMISSTNLWRRPIVKESMKLYTSSKGRGSSDSVWYDHD